MRTNHIEFWALAGVAVAAGTLAYLRYRSMPDNEKAELEELFTSVNDRWKSASSIIPTSIKSHLLG